MEKYEKNFFFHVFPHIYLWVFSDLSTQGTSAHGVKVDLPQEIFFDFGPKY